MQRIPKRKWIKKNSTWYFIAIYSRIIWAKIYHWNETLREDKIQNITIHAIGNNNNHIKAECGGFDLEEAKKFAEEIAISPFPEKLTHKK